jgi:hypothetical protein
LDAAGLIKVSLLGEDAEKSFFSKNQGPDILEDVLTETEESAGPQRNFNLSGTESHYSGNKALSSRFQKYM